MNQPFDFDRFRTEHLALGYDEVLERQWAPGTVTGEHSHPFDAKALVVAGELWLSEAGEERHLRAGDGFELAAHRPHDERYGPEGATYWVARRASR
jgi:hypothetical protein